MPRTRTKSNAVDATPAASSGAAADVPPARRLSRRRFLALIAASGAALPAADVLAATAPHHGKATPAKGTVHIEPTPSYVAPPPPTHALEKGLKEQRESLAGQLKTIRDFELPPGSEQAFAFRPMARARRLR